MSLSPKDEHDLRAMLRGGASGSEPFLARCILALASATDPVIVSNASGVVGTVGPDPGWSAESREANSDSPAAAPAANAATAEEVDEAIRQLSRRVLKLERDAEAMVVAHDALNDRVRDVLRRIETLGDAR